ncbi:hypothetical protein [Clostridium sp.]|uniref:hypothetical protein n=1 Tax=Clostridium sp. TaxID=1506 RepID=UPI0034647AE7
MEWINEVDYTKEKPDAHCGINICWKREEACPENNSCVIKHCATKGCYSFS